VVGLGVPGSCHTWPHDMGRRLRAIAQRLLHKISYPATAQKLLPRPALSLLTCGTPDEASRKDFLCNRRPTVKPPNLRTLSNNLVNYLQTTVSSRTSNRKWPTRRARRALLFRKRKMAWSTSPCLAYRSIFQTCKWSPTMAVRAQKIVMK